MSSLPAAYVKSATPHQRVAADRLPMSSSLGSAGAEFRQMVEAVTFSNPAAVTLTLKKRAGGNGIDEIKASAHFRPLGQRLNPKGLGSPAVLHGRSAPL